MKSVQGQTIRYRGMSIVRLRVPERARLGQGFWWKPKPLTGLELKRLGREAIEDVDQLFEADAAFFRTLLNTLRHAFFDVIPEDGQADPVQCGLSRRQLLQDFKTQTRLLHHALDATHLSLDPVETRHQ